MLYIQYEFGLKSCFHENLAAILVRVFLGVALQFVCSYITFPLYSLVTQVSTYQICCFVIISISPSSTWLEVLKNFPTHHIPGSLVAIGEDNMVVVPNT